LASCSEIPNKRPHDTLSQRLSSAADDLGLQIESVRKSEVNARPLSPRDQSPQIEYRSIAVFSCYMWSRFSLDYTNQLTDLSRSRREVDLTRLGFDYVIQLPEPGDVKSTAL
jgi:hypothetical protein